MEMNTSFDDFMQMLGDDKRVQGLDAGNIKLTYNSVCKVKFCYFNRCLCMCCFYFSVPRFCGFTVVEMNSCNYTMNIVSQQ